MAKREDWWRVVYERNGTRRALFGLGRSTLGGFIVDLGAYKPFTRWQGGIFDLPGSTDTHQVATIDETSRMKPSLAPKFHYHPNGYISINHEGHVDRRFIDGRPLSDLHGDHVLSVVVGKPETFPIVPEGKRDYRVQVGGPDPRTLKFVFFLHQLAELDPRLASYPENGMVIPAENMPSGIPTLMFKFDTYAATISVQPDSPEAPADDHPAIFGAAFDTVAVRDPQRPTPMLVVQSLPEDPASQ